MVRAFTAVVGTAAVVLSALALSALGLAQEPPQVTNQTPNQVPTVVPAPSNSPLAGPTPMRFEWVREGPAERCGNNCREWIAASGTIVESTVHDFEAFARARDVRGATLVLDSPGGNVVQGLALGKEFRRLDLTTSVGKAIKLSTNPNERVILSRRASCNSMCVF